jgi:hypothetical protein
MPSGRSPAGDQKRWRRRPGSPGGARSEAQKLGIAPAAGRTADPDIIEHLRAFLRGDREHFVRVLQLQPWQDTPLTDRRDRCTQRHPLEDRTEPGHGCRDQHQAWALRGRLIDEIERRGRFRFADLDADGDLAAAAWDRLAAVTKRVGVRETEWKRIAGESPSGHHPEPELRRRLPAWGDPRLDRRRGKRLLR